MLVALFGPWVSLGAIIGAAVNYATKSWLAKTSYQVPTACLYIVPVFLTIALIFIPESPRYLLYAGKDAQARKSLLRLRGERAEEQEQIEVEWAQMVRIIEEDKANKTRLDWIDMFRGKCLDEKFS